MPNQTPGPASHRPQSSPPRRGRLPQTAEEVPARDEAPPAVQAFPEELAQLRARFEALAPEDQYRVRTGREPLRSINGTPIEEIVPGLDLRGNVLMTYEEMMSADWQEPPTVIEGILHQGSKMSFVGGSKAFKTWSMLHMALAVASGKPWWGRQTEKGKTFFVNFELQNYFFRKRVEELMVAMEITEEDIRDTFSYRGLRGEKFGTTKALLKKLGEETAAGRYKLGVLEPLYKMLGDRDENSSSDMANLLAEFDELAAKSAAAVVYCHHFPKGNQAGRDSIDRGAGSGVVSRDADSILTMTPHKEAGAFVAELTLRNFRPVEPFVVRRDHPLMVLAPDLDAGDMKTKSGATKTTDEKFPDRDLLCLLDARPLRAGEWFRSAEAELAIPRSTFYKRLKELVEEGTVQKVEGEAYRQAERRPSIVHEIQEREAAGRNARQTAPRS
jgi:hypothetical protein